MTYLDLRVRMIVLGMAFTVASAGVIRIGLAAEDDPANRTWTDPDLAAQEDPDFLIQGEYCEPNEGAVWGVQVVALGGGQFDAYVLEGGLPGAGWNPSLQRIQLNGALDGEETNLSNESEQMTATIRDQRIKVFKKERLMADLPRIERKSDTLDARPPEDAIVLFDGSSSDAWENGQMENGLLANNDITSKAKFTDYSIHLEFRTPYKPYARGQQRGNSGIYHQGRYETQVLDSFGLEGRKNECGGIYSIADPLTNACLPPLSWQTYDVDFTAARVNETGEVTQPAMMTARLNGILVQENQELPHTTTASPVNSISAEAGPIFIQHHRNPVFYRNIWLLPR